MSLIFDGLTGGIQDKIRDNHQSQAYQMMFSMNFWSCIWSLIGVLVTGELSALLEFILMYPFVVKRIFLLAFMGSLGQVREIMK